MRICDIIQQFTHTDFNLIILDIGTDEEYYNGPAEGVYDDPISTFRAVAIEPPLRAGEVILYIDMDAFLDADAEIIEDDVLEEL